MADENKEPLTDQETGDEIKPTQEYTPGEVDRMPEAETGLEEAVNAGIDKSEELAEESPVVQKFDEAVTAVQDAADTLEPEASEISDFRRPMVEAAATAGAAQAVSHGAGHDDHGGTLSDTTTVFGNKITVQGGIYTVIFGFLAAATLIEILIGNLPRAEILIPVLLAIATVKAALVVMYYMHLKTDIRLFTYILIGPTVLAVLAMLYLMAVPR